MREGLAHATLDGIARRAAEAEATLDLRPDLSELAAHGIHAMPIPVAAGGQGVGTAPEGARACLALLRDLGAANLAVARIVEGHVNAVKLVELYATPVTRARVFALVLAGNWLGVWGADAGTPARLEADGDGFILSGGKRYASGLGALAAALVTAATVGNEGPQLVLVPADDPQRADPSTWRQSGMRATASGTYDLGGLRIKADALVGRPGDLLREPYFEGGVWRYCAAHLGGAEALHRAMLHRLIETGRADDPHQARRIVEAASACETARLWIESAAEKVEEAQEEPEIAATYALMAREATEAACLTVIDRVERALGMAAFEDGPIERMRRDLSLFLRQAAPDAKRARIARALVAASDRRATTVERPGYRFRSLAAFRR